MSSTQSWAGLPDHIKRQAAPDMLAGVGWYFYGDTVQHPGADELRRWAGNEPCPPVPATVAGNMGGAPGQPEARQRAHSAIDAAPKPMTRQQKRDAVDAALSSNVNVPDRELARRLGVSHTFIALRRRKAGNVAA